MDPTQDPNFTPPGENPNFEPPIPSKLIPNHTPIQPYVLDEDVSVDPAQPIGATLATTTTGSSAPTTRKERSDRRKQQNLKHMIPKKATELEPSSSNSSSGDELIDERLSVTDGLSGLSENDPSNNAVGGNLISDGVLIAGDNEEALMSPSMAPVSGSIPRSLTPGAVGVAGPTAAAGPSQGDVRTTRTYSTCSGNEPQVRSYQIADLEEVPHGIPRQATSIDQYQFPTHRLKTRLTDPNKYPLCIVACGSFSPITYLHLRMFEMALDSIVESTKFEVIGGFYSPVSDNYKKPGLAPSSHRVRMCELACERTSSWLMVDAWESLQGKYTRTALVLDHFNTEINIKRGGVYKADGSNEKVGVKVMLLAGGDLIESMGEPNVWADSDLHHILGNYGCLIVERTGSDVRSFLLSHDIMYEHRKNILVIKQLIYNDISSTKVRLFIRRHMSVRYLLPNSVIRYIQEHGLYVNDKEPVKNVLNK